MDLKSAERGGPRLTERESYGYEVVQQPGEVGLSEISDGTVYPALARLEREGRIKARLVPSSSGPARKYYQPTPAGRTALTSGTASWRALSDLVNAVLADPAPSTSTERSTK